MAGRHVSRTLLLVLLLASPAIAAGPRRSVTFILDCSQTMSQDLPQATALATDAPSVPLSRLEAARKALKGLFTQSAGTGSQEIALWLFGHRLRWDEGDEPALMEQTDYLEAFLGFEVLGELMPGDDVELVRGQAVLEPDHLEPIFDRLDRLKPWGEDPVFLALVRSLDSLPREANSLNARVVLITDGGNRQWLSKFKSSKSAVLEAVEQRRVPVHIVYLGDTDSDRQAEAEYRQIATRSSGTFERITSPAEFTAALERLTAASSAASDVAANDGESTSTADAADEDAEPAPRTTSAKTKKRRVRRAPPEPDDEPSEPVAKAPVGRVIEGQVTFFGEPVKRASVTLDGAELPPIITGEDGTFRFEDIPEGIYTLLCEANVRNRVRDTSMKLRVNLARREIPAVELKLR